MAQPLPWNVRNIDPELRDAARDAARKAGMSVSDWLEHVIREQALASHMPDSRSSRPEPSRETVDDLQARLRRLSQSASEPALERGGPAGSARSPASRSRQGAPDQNLTALLSHAEQLEQRTRDTENKTATALESIIGWIERAENRMTVSERMAAERQERATSVIADAIKTVSSRVADVERLAQGRAPDPARPDVAPRQAPPRQEMPSRRPALSRDSLAHAVSDIQSRQRELDTAGERPQPAFLRQLRDDIGRVAGHHPERRVGERRAEVTPVMNELRADLARLRQDIAALHAAPASSRLEDGLRELGQRLEQRHPAMPLDELARPLARIEAELGRLQAQDQSPRFGQIERELQRLGERIETLAATSQEPRLLAAAVKEIAALKDSLQRDGHAPRIDDLSHQISALATDMARVREQMSAGGGVGGVEAAIEDMRQALLRETRDSQGVGHGLLQRIMHQLETVADTVAAKAPAAAQSALSEEDRDQLARLSQKLDQLAARTQPESDLLARRIEALAIKLDDMADRGSSDLADRVERLSAQIEELSTRGPAAIERQIDTLSARIEALAQKPQSLLSAPASVDLSPIEDMIADLARRLEDVSRPDSDNSGLQSLERQIEALTRRLDMPQAVQGRADGLETTLQDLMRYLGGLREETTTAVDKAARAAVADALTRTPLAGGASGADLSGLRSELAGLKDVHVSIDQRTHSAIGAVNDTLEKIVQRLAQLEDDISRERAEPATPSLSARPARAPALDEGRYAPARDPRAVSPPSSRPIPDESEMPRMPRHDAQAAQAAREMIRDAARNLGRDAGDGSAMPVRVPRAAPSAAPQVQPQPAPAAPTPQQPAQDALFDSLPDVPLEPGSGRPRARGDAAAQGAGLNPNLIAAARRAAMAASAEAEALGGQEKKGAGEAGQKVPLGTSLRETLEKRRKPILLGLAAIVLAIGAGQVATTMLGDKPAPVAIAPERPADARTTEPAGQARIEQGQPDSGRATPSLPAREPSREPSRDQSSLAPSQPLLQAPETTGSVRPVASDIASLSPASTPPDAGSFSAQPGRVTQLGELPAALGTPGLRRAAMAGDANAVYELAVRAAEGPAATRDAKLALRLFERAAAAGSAPAQFRLANMHEKGIGTGRDAKLAMTWYKRAADKGNAKAMHNLAVLIAEGVDGRPDYAQAAQLFRRAAEFGVRDSQFNLAVLLGRGLGVEQDMVQSYTWFAVAARQGDADAAKKRDEVGAKLSPVDLSAGRTASLNWKPRTPEAAANEAAAPPEGWDPQPRAQTQPSPRPRTS